MTLHFISDYKNDPAYRLSFNELAGKTFGIDFEKWYQLGFWNDRYVCYSFAEGNRIVANVSASRLDLIFKGQRFSTVQIGTVMTEAEFRGRGLAAQLMRRVLSEYEHQCDLIYLFANRSVLDFYPKFGFVPVQESRFTAEIGDPGRFSGGFRRLDLGNSNDLMILKRLIHERRPISPTIDVDQAQSILAWHCLNVFPRDLYYLDDLELLIIYKIQDDVAGARLHLYDVIGARKPEFRPIFERVAHRDITKAVFYFTPHFEDLTIQCHPYEDPDDTLFIKSASVRLTGEFAYPLTGHT